MVTILDSSTLLFLLLGAGTGQPADLVVRNGVIWTADAGNPWAEAVASRGDRIIYVGTNRGVERYLGARTRTVDLKGRLVVPGFNDSHVRSRSR